MVQWFQERNGDVTPDKVREGSLDAYWWKCDKGPDHQWKQMVRVRTKQGTGCRFCAGNEVSVTNSLAALYPDVAELWAYDLNKGLTPDDVVANKNKPKYMWRCPKGPDHIWPTTVNSMTRPKKRGTGCPFCAGRRLSVTNRLDLNHPEIAAQWFQERNGNVTPDKVREGQHKKFWWKCDEGPDHEWPATVSSRTKGGKGCPFCAGHRVSVTNSLATKFPDIAAEWDYERNGDVTPDMITAGETKAERYWVCNKGPDHKWPAKPGTRTNPSVNFPGCPFCAGKEVSVTNSLRTKFPDIAAEWDYERNGNLTPDSVTSGANRPAHWICPDKGHRYRTNINWRTSDVTGCPKCVRRFSFVELVIKFELSKFFNVDLSPTSRAKGTSGGELSVDVLLPDDGIIIEYDGYYYHNVIADRHESDARKTDSLRRAGWTVVRIREEGLQTIGFDDIQVPVVDEGQDKAEQKKEVVNRLLKHLEGIVGRSIPGLDEYISQSDLSRYDDALDSYNAI